MLSKSETSARENFVSAYITFFVYTLKFHKSAELCKCFCGRSRIFFLKAHILRTDVAIKYACKMQQCFTFGCDPQHHTNLSCFKILSLQFSFGCIWLFVGIVTKTLGSSFILINKLNGLFTIHICSLGVFNEKPAP